MRSTRLAITPGILESHGFRRPSRPVTWSVTFVISREGPSSKSTNPFKLLASDDEWTSPIMADVGPDGNVWVIDWYSFIVQHNPTPPGFKTGKGAPMQRTCAIRNSAAFTRSCPRTSRTASPKMTLKDATPEKLVATLKNNNMFWRNHAQRLLVERGKQDVVPALIKLVRTTAWIRSDSILPPSMPCGRCMV